MFEEFDYGFIYKRVREGRDEGDPVWTVGRVTLWPNGFYLGNHFEWRVPIDDENTLSVCWFFMRVPKGREPYVQDKVPTWVSPIKDANGRWISSHVINQDIIAWVGQGTIADRSKENLGASDLGIAMMRKRLFDELDAVAQGRGAKGDDAQRQCRQDASSCRTSPRRRASKASRSRSTRTIRCSKSRLKGFRHCYRSAARSAPRVRGGDGHSRSKSELKPLHPRPQLNFPGPGAARLADQIEIGAAMASGSSRLSGLSARLGRRVLLMPPSITT